MEQRKWHTSSKVLHSDVVHVASTHLSRGCTKLWESKNVLFLHRDKRKARSVSEWDGLCHFHLETIGCDSHMSAECPIKKPAVVSMEKCQEVQILSLGQGHTSTWSAGSCTLWREL